MHRRRRGDGREHIFWCARKHDTVPRYGERELMRLALPRNRCEHTARTHHVIRMHTGCNTIRAHARAHRTPPSSKRSALGSTRPIPIPTLGPRPRHRRYHSFNERDGQTSGERPSGAQPSRARGQKPTTAGQPCEQPRRYASNTYAAVSIRASKSERQRSCTGTNGSIRPSSKIERACRAMP